jgi:hypothetical protein
MQVVKRCWIIVAWLLMLALPLQGLAVAAPAMSFGSMHDVPAAADAGTVAPCHGIDTGMADEAPGAHAGCAQCAVCHASAAPLPPLAAAPGPAPRAEAPPAWTSPILTAVDPDGLDRPPRSRLV